MVIVDWTDPVLKAHKALNDEMLDVLEQLIEWELDYRLRNNLGHQAPFPFLQAKAVIAKAKGEAQ